MHDVSDGPENNMIPALTKLTLFGDEQGDDSIQCDATSCDVFRSGEICGVRSSYECELWGMFVAIGFFVCSPGRVCKYGDSVVHDVHCPFAP